LQHVRRPTTEQAQLERFRKLAWNDDALPKLFYANAIDALRLNTRDAFRNSPE
jgi:hypothetical protein